MQAAIFLMNNGADVDIADSNGCTPLHICTMKANLPRMIFLFE